MAPRNLLNLEKVSKAYGHDPVLDECARASGTLRLYVYRRLQRHIRDVVDPQLGERLALLEENAALKAEVAALKAPRGRKSDAA